MSLFTIRKAQMMALERTLLLPWLETEIQVLYPEECAAMGPIDLTRFVAEGVKSADRLDIPGSDCLAYLAMEITFGEGFADNPSNGWARQALPGDRDNRMQRLRRAAMFKLAEQVEHERRQENARREDERAALEQKMAEEQGESVESEAQPIPEGEQ